MLATSDVVGGHRVFRNKGPNSAEAAQGRGELGPIKTLEAQTFCQQCEKQDSQSHFSGNVVDAPHEATRSP